MAIRTTQPKSNRAQQTARNILGSTIANIGSAARRVIAPSSGRGTPTFGSQPFQGLGARIAGSPITGMFDISAHASEPVRGPSSREIMSREDPSVLQARLGSYSAPGGQGDYGGSGTGGGPGGGDSGGYDTPWGERGISPEQWFRHLQEEAAREISEGYQPALDLLTQQEKQITADYPTEVSQFESRVTGEEGKAQTEKKQLLADQATSEEEYHSTIRSALDQALRAYNALNQQRQARFGLGSSAGGAVGELASQEYFRQQGGLQREDVRGTQQYVAQKQKITDYVQQKLDDLSRYKNETLLSLKQNFQGRLNEIAARRGDIEANKTRDKMAALQGLMAQTQQIASADQAFRQNLLAAAVSNLQQISGRAIAIPEIKSMAQQFGINLGAQVGPTAQAGPAYNPNLTRRNNLGQLIDENGNPVYG